jgi:hypothetical protein
MLRLLKDSTMHIGKNISKVRELLGIKQDSLAAALKISQQAIAIKSELTGMGRYQVTE